MEKELLLAPHFFVRLTTGIDSLGGADVQLKRGNSENELTRYRYEVALSKSGRSVCNVAAAPRLRWGNDVAGLEALSMHLAIGQPPMIRVAGVPNQRLSADSE